MSNLVFIVIAFAGMIAGYTVFSYLPKLIDNIFDKTPGLNRINKTLAYFISEFISFVIVIMLAFYGVGQLSEVATLIAILLTVASGVFAFTSKGWITDAFVGLSLQFFPQYNVDNWVTLNGKRGQVVRLGLFRTQLATMDLEIISVKNSKVLSGDITNHSDVKLRRLILLVRVVDYGAYGLDIKAFKADALSVITEVQNKLCPEAIEIYHKKPKIWFVEFSPQSDHLNVIFFNKETGRRKALDGINVALAMTFRPKQVIFGDASIAPLDDCANHVFLEDKN